MNATKVDHSPKINELREEPTDQESVLDNLMDAGTMLELHDDLRLVGVHGVLSLGHGLLEFPGVNVARQSGPLVIRNYQGTEQVVDEGKNSARLEG